MRTPEPQGDAAMCQGGGKGRATQLCGSEVKGIIYMQMHAEKEVSFHLFQRVCILVERILVCKGRVEPVLQFALVWSVLCPW